MTVDNPMKKSIHFMPLHCTKNGLVTFTEEILNGKLAMENMRWKTWKTWKFCEESSY